MCPHLGLSLEHLSPSQSLQQSLTPNLGLSPSRGLEVAQNLHLSTSSQQVSTQSLLVEHQYQLHLLHSQQRPTQKTLAAAVPQQLQADHLPHPG